MENDRTLPAHGGAGLSNANPEAVDAMQRELARRLFALPGFVRIFGKPGDERLVATRSNVVTRALEALQERRLIEKLETANGESQCRLTAEGRQWVLAIESPKDLLCDALRVCESHADRLGRLAAEFAALRDNMLALADIVRPLCVSAAMDDGERMIVDALSEDALKKQPSAPTLPQLFERMRARRADLTIGQFHDVVRWLHARGRLRLAPWTGPLYQLPEPTLALLVGHEVLYYVELQRLVAAA